MARHLIISDTHFFQPVLHEKIAVRKNFTATSNLLDEYMRDEWNKMVKDDDIVIHIGDVAFHQKDKCREMIKSLKGKKILVRGNHDRGVDSMIDMGFYAVFEQLVVSFKGMNILFVHRPWYEPLPKGIYGVCHGHVHTGEKECLIAAGEEPEIPDFNVNLCVEKTNFKPILINEAIGRLHTQLKKVGWWPWYGGPNPLVKPVF